MKYFKILMMVVFLLPATLWAENASPSNEEISKNLIHQYYKTLLAQNVEGFINLLSEDVVHEINQGSTEKGKSLFKTFMINQFADGKFNINDLVMLTSPDGRYGMVRYNCSGKYEKTVKGYPAAKGQYWEVPIVTYFEFDNQKISHVAVYYNKSSWLKQITA